MENTRVHMTEVLRRWGIWLITVCWLVMATIVPAAAAADVATAERSPLWPKATDTLPVEQGLVPSQPNHQPSPRQTGPAQTGAATDNVSTAPVTTPYPALRGDIYAQDFAGILSRTTVQKIRSVGRALEDKTGAQVVVATMPSIPDGDMQMYATELFRRWGIGNKAKNNGILLLVVPSAKQVRIEVGYGMEGALNDAKAGEILDRYFVPYAKQNQFEQGILQTYGALVGVTMQEYGITEKDLGTPGRVEKPERQSGSVWPLAFLIGVLMLDGIFNRGRLTRILLLMFFSRGGGGGSGGGGGFGGGFRGGGGGSSGGGGAGRSW